MMPQGSVLSRYLQEGFQLDRQEIAEVIHDCIGNNKQPATLTTDANIAERVAGLLLSRNENFTQHLRVLFENSIPRENLDWLQVVTYSVVDVLRRNNENGLQRIITHVGNENIWTQTPRLLMLLRAQIEELVQELPLTQFPSKYMWQRLITTFFWNNSKTGLSRKTFSKMYDAAHATGNMTLKHYLDESSRGDMWTREEIQHWFLLLCCNGNAKFAKECYLSKKGTDEDAKIKGLGLAVFHGKLAMVKTLLATLVPDDKLYEKLLIISCSRGHRGVFEWFCEQKHVQTEEFLQGVLPMCAWASLLFEHERLYQEIGELLPSKELTVTGLKTILGIVPQDFSEACWGHKDCVQVLKKLNKEETTDLLKHLVSEKSLDPFFKVVRYAGEFSPVPVLEKIKERTLCSKVVSEIWNKISAAGVEFPIDCFSDDQKDFILRDAIFSDCVETFLLLLPHLSKDRAPGIASCIHPQNSLYYRKTFGVYFPELV